MIRLYKMELYKLFQNRIFRLGMLSAIVLLALYFCLAEVGGEIAVVDGVSYSGYEAVRINRQITAEFEGELTDEKVNQIIERYGLPSKLEENLPGWRDGNFLNDFVTRFFTNGSWEGAALPTEQYAFADTELAKASAKTGQSPYLAIQTGLGFVALLSLCAITLCVSAHLNSTFGAVIIAASFWGLPVLIRMFFGGFMAVIVDSMPVFLIMTTIINDICVIWGLVLLINIFLAGTCLINGIFTYKNKQLT